MTTLGICAVRSGSERQAQRDIERAGFGTRNPTYRVGFNRLGNRHVQLRSLFPGMVFADLQPGYGALDELEGVRVLKIGGKPLIIKGKDEERLARLELHGLLGDFNKERQKQPRNGFGQFSNGQKSEPAKPKQKKRRQRSLMAKAERRRKRRAKRRGLRNHTDATNQIAA